MKFLSNLKKSILNNKKISLGFVLLIGLGYWFLGGTADNTSVTKFVLGRVALGTVVESISGSGQVAGFSQVDLKARASGDVNYVGVKNGENVYQGKLLLQLDASDAAKNVRDAQISLDSAKLSLQKIKRPTDALTLLQAQNDLDKAKASLVKTYDDGFNKVADAFLDLPTAITGLNSIFYSSDMNLNGGQLNISFYTDGAKFYEYGANLGKAESLKLDLETKYKLAKQAYATNFDHYKSATRISSNEKIESLVKETYQTAAAVSEALKGANNLIQYYQDQLAEGGRSVNALTPGHLANLISYIGKANGRLADLLTVKNNLIDATTLVPEKEQYLEKLKLGTDALDIQASEISLKQRENALADANDTFKNYSVYAPFTGTIAKLNVRVGDSVSSGFVFGTLITSQKMAEITLNEVDVARVKLHQKATLTFDALSDLTIAGEVAEIDSIGTVSSGVVTYAVKIAFASQDERVKSGMSVSAAIVTELRQDVLTLPVSALKSSSNNYYVETIPLAASAKVGDEFASSVIPVRVPVVTGLESDSLVEIVSGIKEGDLVIVRTINASSATAVSTTSSQSLLGILSGGRGAARVGGGGGGAPR